MTPPSDSKSRTPVVAAAARRPAISANAAMSVAQAAPSAIARTGASRPPGTAAEARRSAVAIGPMSAQGPQSCWPSR